MFCHNVFDHAEKQLDEKLKVHFKIYGDANLRTNNYNKHIARYLIIIIIIIIIITIIIIIIYL